MAKAKPNLSAALAKKHEPEPEAQQAETPLTKRAAKPAQSSRAGQTNIAAWFPQEVKFTLDELRLRRQRELGRKVTIQELIGESYNDLFKKYGLPEVAPTHSEG